MMDIEYRVYSFSFEAYYERGRYGWRPPEITDELIADRIDDNHVEFVTGFDTEEEAVQYVKDNAPQCDISGPMGTGVKYLLVSGLVAEEYQIYDDEGDYAEEYCGSLLTSAVPN